MADEHVVTIQEMFEQDVLPAVDHWRESEDTHREAWFSMLDATYDAVMKNMVIIDPLGKMILHQHYVKFFEMKGIKTAVNTRHPFNAPFKYALFGHLPWGVIPARLTQMDRTKLKTATEQVSRYASLCSLSQKLGLRPSEMLMTRGNVQNTLDFYQTETFKKEWKEMNGDDAEPPARPSKKTDAGGMKVKEANANVAQAMKKAEKSQAEADSIALQLREAASRLQAEKMRVAEAEGRKQAYAMEKKKQDLEMKRIKAVLAAEARAERAKFKAVAAEKLSTVVEDMDDVIVHMRKVKGKWMIVDKPVMYIEFTSDLMAAPDPKQIPLVKTIDVTPVMDIYGPSPQAAHP